LLKSIPSSGPHELFRKEDNPKGRASQAHPAIDPRSNPRPSDEQKSSRVSLKTQRSSSKRERSLFHPKRHLILIFVIEELARGRVLAWLHLLLSTPAPDEEDFMADNPFEIPQTMRDLAEQNMKQAHAAYDQLTDFVTKAMGAWMGAMPSNPMATGFKDVQDRAVEMAKKNAESAFALAEKIAKAQNFQDILTLQTRFAQEQMQAYATETQELHKLIGDAVQKLQHS
jgi:hypothetical protein